MILDDSKDSIDGGLRDYLRFAKVTTYSRGVSGPLYDYVPIIGEFDIAVESITRYFIQRFNETNVDDIFEVASQDYDVYIKSPSWVGIQVPWRVAGLIDTAILPNGVKILGANEANRFAIAYAKKIITDIDKKLKNPLQYFQGFLSE